MNLLITGAWREAYEYVPMLKASGYQVHFLQWEKNPLPCAYDWVEGVICNALFLYHPIEQFTNLRYIQLTSAGYDRIPLDYIQSHAIELYNAKGVYSIPMAEHAVSGVLQLYKKSRLFTDNQKKHLWKKQRDLQELFGKTVCIIGCGSVGEECAKRFRAFGCRVFGVRRHFQPNEWFDAVYTVNDLDKFLPEADILVLAVPLTEETKHLINTSNISKLKKSSVIVNLSRGSIMETAALVSALNAEMISGAVLDVFEEEPLQEDNILWDMKQVILTPHNSYAGEGNAKRLGQLILDNITCHY